MTGEDEAFLQQLRAAFRVEAEEHLRAMTTSLLDLEKKPEPDAQAEIIETVFRAAHSLKGAARAVDFTRIESVCQQIEEVFSSWKRREAGPTSEALDRVHRDLDLIAALLAEEGRTGTSVGPAPPARPAPAPKPAPVAAATLSGSDATVRIAVAKLEARLAESEELLTAKLTAAQRVAELRELMQRFAAWRESWTALEPDLRQVRSVQTAAGAGGAAASLARIVDFFESGLDTLKAIDSRVALLARTADQDRQAVGKLVDDLLNEAKTLLLLPFSTISSAFPRLVRDLSREQGKDAELVIRGDAIEVDKRILEELKDPLVHLLRNSIDHGVEAPAERERCGKPARAKIELTVSQVNGNKVQLLLSDDGAGLDLERVKAAAVSRGIVSAEEASDLDEAQTRALIFRSEVSTSPIITQLSGRGLGLAIVHEKVVKLGGEVAVESRPGTGTAFRLVIPTTRATFRGILIESAGHLLVVPTTQVERVTRINREDVLTVEGRETISLEGRTLPLVPLDAVLELASAPNEERTATQAAVVVGAADQRIAFAVDAVLDEQEVLVKLLRKPLSRVRNVAAVTVLGSGAVAPILNVTDLMKSARRAAARPRPAEAPTAQQPADKSILVAEDSITSRMLIKNILESAGYRVKTAVDGAEAYATLRAEEFDLLVSDVEMPRLNGFDLTARIRADRRLAELPVVLVTALETPEDRERGIDVGANAYLVKSSFDQSNLLEAVRRLL